MNIKGFFYRDKDQAFLVSDAIAKNIKKAIIRGENIDTGGKILYPIFKDPTEKELRAGKLRTPAWLIRNGSTPTLRWYWQVREHKKADMGCKPLGDGLCGFKMVRFYEWNASASKWELSPMVNHADTQQEQVLDNS